MDNQFKEAIEAVDGGMSMKKISNLFDIPYFSFHEWYYGVGKTRKKELPTVFSPYEE